MTQTHDEVDPIDRYLDDICKHLSMMPAVDVEQNRRELRQHLDIAVEALMSQGTERAVAVGETLTKFGPAKRVGKQIAEASPYAWVWKRAENDGPEWLERATVLLYVLQIVLMVICSWITFKFHLPLNLLAVPFPVTQIPLGILSRISSAYRYDYDGMSRALGSRMRKVDLSSDLPLNRLIRQVASAYVVAFDFQGPMPKRTKQSYLPWAALIVALVWSEFYFNVKQGIMLVAIMVLSWLATGIVERAAKRGGAVVD